MPNTLPADADSHVNGMCAQYLDAWHALLACLLKTDQVVNVLVWLLTSLQNPDMVTYTPYANKSRTTSIIQDMRIHIVS